MALSEKQRGLLLNLMLIVGGIVFAGMTVFIFLALFPQFQPGMVIFRVKHGDIFFHHPQWMAVPENYEEMLSIHRVTYDEDGFRVPEHTASDYDVLALGDSFTEAMNAPRPWTDTLAAASGLTVRNLGYRGFGPVEEAYILGQVAPRSSARIVIIGFFEGNDLSNALSAQDAELVLPADITPEDREMLAVDFADYPERDERYPMQMTLNGTLQDIAFFEWYVWGLNATSERVYRRSQNMALTVEAWQQTRAAAGDACVILAYFPSKPHVYLPYLTPESQQRLMSNTHQRIAQAGQPLDQIRAETTFDALLQRRGYLRDAVRDAARGRAEASGLVFFDTTPVLQAAAERGEMVYYVYDTHWNQRGHDLVGEALAQFLAGKPCGE